MRAQTDKKQADTSKAVAGTARQVGQAKATGKIADHRPTAIAQRKLQQTIGSKLQTRKAPASLAVPRPQQVVQQTQASTKLPIQSKSNINVNKSHISSFYSSNSYSNIAQLKKEYGEKETYSDFMYNLEEVDNSSSKPKEKQEQKNALLSEFHGHLKALSVSEIKKFGTQLLAAIETHEKTDNLNQAFEENRVIYRSWHSEGRISESAAFGATVEGGKELVGEDYLQVALNPGRFISYKAKAKAEGLPVIDAVPSSILDSVRAKNVVFNTDRGTATALLPENLYAGFSAYNEAVKNLLRDKSSEGLDNENKELKEQAKFMRAYVTRPVFFDNDDIQSDTGAYEHDDKDKSKGPHVRKTHSGLEEEYNPLRKSLDEKLVDPFRVNAIFYQTFFQHSKPNLHEWNEMVVKYRATGHTASIRENTACSIAKRLENSGKFSEEKAAQGAVFVKPLRGSDFDSSQKKSAKSRK